MDDSENTNNVLLVVINHPQSGKGEAGRRICDKVREILSPYAGRVLIFHDATNMVHADFEYALRFKELDIEQNGKKVESVCAIPLMLPRLMAMTVSKVSSNKWTICRKTDDAISLLSSRGVSVDGLHTSGDDVISRKITLPNAA